ncbi:MAG TPA: DUF2171 domain-containing protein [Ktedonobacterales bacterium]|jgi:hypothetical protein
MDVNPQQYEPPTREPGERQTQFGQGSQADVPLTHTPHDVPMTNPGQAIGPSGITPGADVYGSDDKKVGTVQQAFEDSFLVRKGMLFVHDYYIPYAYVARVSPDRIDLNMTSDEARDQDWTQRPGTGVGGSVSPRPAATEFGVYGPTGPQDTIQGATEGDNTLVADTGGEASVGNPGGTTMPVAGLTPMAGMGMPPSPAPTTGGEILTGAAGETQSTLAGKHSGTGLDAHTEPRSDVMNPTGRPPNANVAGTDLPRTSDIISNDPDQIGGAIDPGRPSGRP